MHSFKLCALCFSVGALQSTAALCAAVEISDDQARPAARNSLHIRAGQAMLATRRALCHARDEPGEGCAPRRPKGTVWAMASSRASTPPEREATASRYSFSASGLEQLI